MTNRQLLAALASALETAAGTLREHLAATGEAPAPVVTGPVCPQCKKPVPEPPTGQPFCFDCRLFFDPPEG